MTDSILKLTAKAADHIREVVRRHDGDKYFRISIKPSGCSGYMYQPEIVDAANADDLKIESQGLSIFIDPKAIPVLRGTTLDLIDKGLGQHQLQFHNPNAVSECGCGESFSLKEDDNE